MGCCTLSKDFLLTNHSTISSQGLTPWFIALFSPIEYLSNNEWIEYFCRSPSFFDALQIRSTIRTFSFSCPGQTTKASSFWLVSNRFRCRASAYSLEWSNKWERVKLQQILVEIVLLSLKIFCLSRIAKELWGFLYILSLPFSRVAEAEMLFGEACHCQEIKFFY